MAEITLMQDPRINHNERAVGIDPGTGTAEIHIRINGTWRKVRDVTAIESAVFDVRVPFKIVLTGDAAAEVYQ